MMSSRQRFLLTLASVFSALMLSACVTTGSPSSKGANSSGSGVSVYGTVDVGVSR